MLNPSQSCLSHLFDINIFLIYDGDISGAEQAGHDIRVVPTSVLLWEWKFIRTCLFGPSSANSARGGTCWDDLVNKLHPSWQTNKDSS